MKLPQIPNSFAFANQVVVPFPNSFDKVGTIETLFVSLAKIKNQLKFSFLFSIYNRKNTI